MDLLQLRDLYDRGRYQDLLKESQKSEYPEQTRYFEIIALAVLGRLVKARKLAEILLSYELQPEDRFNAQVVLVYVLKWIAVPQYYDEVDRCYEIYEQLLSPSPFWYGFLLHTEGINGYTELKAGDIEKYQHRVDIYLIDNDWLFLRLYTDFSRYADSVIDAIPGSTIQLEEVSTQIIRHSYKLIQGYVNVVFAVTKMMKGDMRGFLLEAQQTQKTWHEIGFAVGDTYYHAAIGLYHFNQGQYEQAFTAYSKAISYSLELSTEFSLGSNHRFLGECLYRQGNLKEAFPHYLKSVELRERDRDPMAIAESYSHIGKIYQTLGELEQAKYYFEAGLSIRREMGYKAAIASSIDLLANFFLEVREFERSRELYTESLELKRAYSNPQQIAESQVNLILVSLPIGQEIIQYLDELEQLVNQSESTTVKNYLKLATGLVWHNSTRSLYKSQAQALFRLLLEEKFDYTYRILILKRIIDGLIWELSISNDPEIQQDLTFYLGQLTKIAEEQTIPDLQIKVALVQSQLYNLEQNSTMEQRSLAAALTIAEQNQLRHQAVSITHMIDNITTEDTSFTELVGLDDIRNLDDQQISIKEFEIIALTVVNTQLSILFSKIFSDIEFDSKMLVNHISKTEILEFNQIKRLAYEQYVILIKEINNISFCLVVKGSTYSSGFKLEALVSAIQLSSTWQQIVEKQEFDVDSQRYLSSLCSQLFAVQIPDTEPEHLDDIPVELLNYKFLLHPVRLTILRLLHSYYRYPAAELRQLLDISWGTFNDHLVALEKKEYIEVKKEFIKDTAMNVVYLTPQGDREYEELSHHLQDLLQIR